MMGLLLHFKRKYLDLLSGYNNTCHNASNGDTFSRIQVVTNHLNEDLVHTANFMISNMKEEDNGNVTLLNS